mmetsp:Transcript_23442/g.73476  ORF Transcript_23442/g.73476 Transcript_23442/m.73476 type:complete len:486 (+) Transcript_23442:112-1569(+)
MPSPPPTVVGQKGPHSKGLPLSIFLPAPLPHTLLKLREPSPPQIKNPKSAAPGRKSAPRPAPARPGARRLGHGPAVGHLGNVQVLVPLLLHVLRGEGARAQRLLRLQAVVQRPLARHAKHERRLVGRGRAASDAEARVPAAVDALGRVHEVQLHALVDEAGVAGHDDAPAGAAGAHGGHVEALLPLLVDPLEGEAVAHLVRLLCVLRALGHHHQAVAAHAPGERGDVEALLPLLHDPLLGQEGVGELVHLVREPCARVHHEGPQLVHARHGAHEQVVVVALLHVLGDALGRHVVVVALLHRRMGVVDRDPLGGGHPHADLLLRLRVVVLVLQALAGALAELALGRALGEDGTEGAGAAERLEERDEVPVLGLLVELHVDHDLHELAEGRGRVAAELLRRRRHLLLADEVALVVALVPLPREAPLEEEQQCVGERFEVVAAAARPPKVRVHAGVAHSAPEHVGALVVVHVRPDHLVLPAGGQAQVH